MKNEFRITIAFSAALLTAVAAPPVALATTSSASISAKFINPGFSDLDPHDEHYDDFITCYQNGYMPGGYDLARLEPEKPVTRADIASLLFGLSGEALNAGYGTDDYPCKDVSYTAWYSRAVGWAIEQGLMKCNDRDQFLPDNPISKEEAAFLLFSYKSKYGEAPTLSSEEINSILSTISDAQNINADHREAAAWCIREGLFVSSDEFNPHSTVEKGEIAHAACLLQPTALVPSEGSVIVSPVALYYGGNDIDLAVRGFCATKVTWEKKASDSDTWETVEDNSAHIKLPLSEYCDSTSTIRCTIQFENGEEEIIDLRERTPRLFNLAGTDQHQDYCTSLDEDGALTLISFDRPVDLSVDAFKSPEFASIADKVTSIQFLGNFNAPKDARGLFSDSYSSFSTPLFPNLEHARLSNINFANTEYANGLFSNYMQLKTVSFDNLNFFSGIAMDYAFSNCSNLKRVDFRYSCLLKSSSYMFYNCEKLETISSAYNNHLSLGGDAQSTFEGCSSLVNVPAISTGVGAPLSDAKRLFMGCSSLTSLNLSGWDITSMPTTDRHSTSTLDSMFEGCSGLKNLDISNWNFSKPVSITHFFEGCSSLHDLNLSGWDKAKFVNLTATFNECESLKKLDLSNWNVEDVLTATGAFHGCKALTSLYLSKWSTPNLKRTDFMFGNCPSLKYLDLGDINTRNIEKEQDMREMFEGTPNITSITLGADFRFPNASIGFMEIPNNMIWRARNAGAILSSTSALMAHQNSRTYAGPETYTLIKATEDGFGGGSGGETTQPDFSVVDGTNDKIEISAFGDSSFSITRVETSFLENADAEYKALSSQAHAGEMTYGAYEIAITGKGKVIAAFNIGKEFNGKVIRIVQLKNNGEITSSPAAVIDGTAAIIMNSSASVMIFAESEAAASFPDVPADAWYVTSGILDYSVSHNLLGGYDGGTFGPNDAFTRGQTVTVLWRIAGCPEVESKAFDDVDYSQFYGKAVSWARKVGIAGGYEGTNDFGPNDPIGRAQLAVMLANYAKVIENMNPSGDSSSMAGKEDVASVPSWALDSMSWAVKQGIMSGRVIDGKEFLCPNDGAVRCEAAKMLTIFHRDVLKEG